MSLPTFLRRSLALIGLERQTVFRSIRGIPRYLRDRREFRRLAADRPGQLPWGPAFPCLGDAAETGGTISGAYFHQDLLVARRIFEAAPDRHVDVGSRIDGFIAHLAVFRTVEVLDCRELSSRVPRIIPHRLDLLDPLPPEFVRCTTSLSCLHALEHMGLGRYGDALDPDGHRRGLHQLAAILRPGGILYLSVPLGPTRVEFNAHRVFALPDLIGLLRDEFTVRRLSIVDDAGDLHEDQSWDGPEAARSYGCTYGCAIVEAERL